MPGIAWMQESDPSDHRYGSLNEHYTGMFEMYCAKTGVDIYSAAWGGRSDLSSEEMITFLRETFRPSSCENDLDTEGNARRVDMYADHGYALVDFRSHSTNVHVNTSDRKIVDKLREKLSRHIFQHSDPGRVFMLTPNPYGAGLAFDSIGIGGSDLIRDNYAESVLEGYDHFIGELKTREPCGRLVLLVGPTGTGKTHLIRAMLNAGDANFAFLPPQMVPEVGGPSIIKAIKDFQNSHKKRPLCLVIEDADDCLLPRGNDNMGSISALLNASEGVLGQLLDVRIIATTNANLKAVDVALSRPGRLCCRMDVNRLDPPHANRVLKRVIGDEEEFPLYDSPASLAEIYSKAKKLAGKSGHTKTLDRRLGFGRESGSE